MPNHNLLIVLDIWACFSTLDTEINPSPMLQPTKIQLLGMVACLLVVFSLPLAAAPYHGEVMQFRQPDHTLVDVRLFGTEYYMRAESMNGYTVIRDENSGYICYACLSEDGDELVSTGTIYRGAANNPVVLKNQIGISKHLQLPLRAVEQKVQAAKASLNHSWQSSYVNKGAVTGTVKGLFILIDFSDAPSNVESSEFENFCNDINYTGYGNKGSVRSYFKDISGGLLDYQNVVYGYYRAPKTFAYYDQLPEGDGAVQILEGALKWINSLGFDFSTLTLNPDKSIKAINLVYTGEPQNWANGMWWHQGTWDGFSADGVHSSVYCCGTAGSPLYLSTIVHENGHMLFNWNDTYKYNQNLDPDGIGTFDLMCNQGNRYNPVPPNPFCIYTAGWATLYDMTGKNENIKDIANDNVYNIYRDVNDTSQFYILENRKKIGRSLYIPDEGLAIWLVDKRGDNQSNFNEVTLIHADDDASHTINTCFHEGLLNHFGAKTFPTAKFHDGNFSGMNLIDISQVRDTMTYFVGIYDSVSVVQYVASGISNDQKPVNYLEPGESGKLHFKIGNTGLVGSGNTRVKCTADFNSHLVTVNTEETALGNIAPNQDASVAFSISVDPQAPIGAFVSFIIYVTDHHNEVYYEYNMIIGEQVLLGVAEKSTCSCMFYDNGGYDRNYSNRSLLKTTLFPAVPGKSIQADFTSFCAEVSDVCGYDYLKVFDGPGTASPLIGTYCGFDVIGTITSTDPTGALTFQFFSDGAVSESGWRAMITCTGPEGTTDKQNFSFFSIYPNPARDRIHITLSDAGPDDFTLVLVNAAGQRIGIRNSQKGFYDLDRSAIPSGNYLVELWQGNQKRGTQQLILK
jgi:M6 family metalloprotease-like protein